MNSIIYLTSSSALTVIIFLYSPQMMFEFIIILQAHWKNCLQNSTNPTMKQISQPVNLGLNAKDFLSEMQEVLSENFVAKLVNAFKISTPQMNWTMKTNKLSALSFSKISVFWFVVLLMGDWWFMRGINQENMS